MILRLIAVACIVCACGTTSEPRIYFRQAFNDEGVIEFDLKIPRASWPWFSHGEPIGGGRFGPFTSMALVISIAAGFRKTGLCQEGWTVQYVTLDEEGAHHFRGVCLEHPEQT